MVSISCATIIIMVCATIILWLINGYFHVPQLCMTYRNYTTKTVNVSVCSEMLFLHLSCDNKVVLKKTNVSAQCMQIIFIEAKS